MIARTRVQVNTDSHEGLQVETYSTFLIFSMVPASGRLGNQLQSQRSKGVREQVGEAIRNELVLLKYRRGGARIWFVMYTVATAIDVIDVMLAAGRRAPPTYHWNRQRASRSKRHKSHPNWFGRSRKRLFYSSSYGRPRIVLIWRVGVGCAWGVDKPSSCTHASI